MSETNTGTEIPGEVEARAREMGWRPKDEWEGDDKGWMDADDFIERQDKRRAVANEEFKAENEKLKKALDSLKAEHAETRQTIEDFKGWKDKAEERIYKKALKDLQAQQRAAVESGDTDAFDAASKEIGELVDETKAQPKSADDVPAYRAWSKENKWYNTNYELTAYANDIGPIIMRAEKLSPDDRDYYDRVTEEVRKKFPDAFENPNRKRADAVESPGGDKPKKGRGPADLPADAREVGLRYIKIGLFEDMKEYAEDYFAQEES